MATTPDTASAMGAATAPIATLDETSTRTRTFLTRPGEHLLLPPQIMDIPTRHAEFIAYTGLSPHDVVVSTMASIPLPLYPPGGFRGRRWEGVDPVAMWLPLMWLPTRVALPYRTDDPASGTSSYETPDEWAARVALEVSASGLYDPETGQWTDVLAMHGIDISDPDAVERVGSWLAGSTDPILDGIDLSERFTRPHEEHWAAEVVEAMGAPLLQSRFALLAADVCEIFDDLANPDIYGDEDLGGVRSLAAHILEMAELELSELSEQSLKALDMGVGSADEMRAVWRQHAADVASRDVGSLDELLSSAIAPAAETANRVRNLFTRDYESVMGWLSGEQRIPGVDYGDEEADVPAPAGGSDDEGESMRMLPGSQQR